MISVLIMTRDEEMSLPGCIESVRFSDDIHVLDSLSTDRTPELARSLGARIAFRPLDDWSRQQNWALTNLPFRYPWVFQIDADERATPELARGLLDAAAAPGKYVAFRVRRRDFFLGAWLRRAQASPFYIRLYRPGSMRFERLVNPRPLTSGPVGLVPGFLDHYPLSKGLAQWVARHNAYSSLEARQIVMDHQEGRGFSIVKALLGRDFNERRHHQKELLHRLPARPLVRFLLLYAVRGGFLDGRAGLVYSLLQAFYELMIVLKIRETEIETKISTASQSHTFYEASDTRTEDNN